MGLAEKSRDVFSHGRLFKPVDRCVLAKDIGQLSKHTVPVPPVAFRGGQCEHKFSLLGIATTHELIEVEHDREAAHLFSNSLLTGLVSRLSLIREHGGGALVAEAHVPVLMLRLLLADRATEAESVICLKIHHHHISRCNLEGIRHRSLEWRGQEALYSKHECLEPCAFAHTILTEPNVAPGEAFIDFLPLDVCCFDANYLAHEVLPCAC